MPPPKLSELHHDVVNEALISRARLPKNARDGSPAVNAVARWQALAVVLGWLKEAKMADGTRLTEIMVAEGFLSAERGKTK